MKKFVAVLLFLLIQCAAVSAEEGDYLVCLRDDVPMPISSALEPLFPEAGIWLAHSLEEIEALGPAVDSWEEDFLLYLADYPDDTNDPDASEQWYLDTICAPYARRYDVRGEGVKVAVIDSGLSPDAADLDKSRILQGYNCVTPASDPPPGDTTDEIGHGTKVTGIIAAQINNGSCLCGIADRVKILPLKVVKEDGSINASFVTKALQKALAEGCTVVNMSFSTKQPEFNYNPSNALKEALDTLAEKNILMVAAVGNYNSQNTGDTKETLTFPASHEAVIGVGSIDKKKACSSFSYEGDMVFCTAPGENFPALSLTGGVEPSANNAGTSFSAPQVTAAAALAKSIDPNLTIAEFKQLLEDSCDDLGNAGWDTQYGYGLLNIQKMLELLFAKQDYSLSVYGNYTDENGTHLQVRNTGAAPLSADVYAVSPSGVPANMQKFSINPGYGVLDLPPGPDFSKVLFWEPGTLTPLAPTFANH